MKTIAIKLLKDLWRAKGKFLLCVLAASLSAWGISSVYYSFLMSERDFKANFSAANPADMVLRIENGPPDLPQILKANEHVAQIERREVLSGRVKSKEGKWMPILIHAVDSIQQVNLNKFKLLETTNAAPDALFIEKNGGGFLGPPAEDLVIQRAGMDSVRMTRAGFVHDAGLPPSQMERMVYGYINLAAIEPWLSKTSQRFLIKTTEKNPTGAGLQKIGAALKTIIEQHGGTLASMSIPPPGEHPHQNIVDGISFMQQTFGFVLALLGVALLSLILLTWLFPQIPQIGIMKAVGSYTRNIFGAYLVILSLVIGLGLLVGMPLGYQTAALYNRFVAFIQNFTPVKAPFPIATHLPIILTAMVIPLVFCVFPLIRVSKTSVQRALSKTFYTPQKAIFRFLQKLISDSRLKYSLNNAFRNSQNTGLLVLILTTGTGLFFTGANLRYSITHDFKQYFKAKNYELTFYLADSQQVSTDFLLELPFVKSIAHANRKSVVFQAPAKDFQENTNLKVFSGDYQLSPDLFLSGKPDPSCSNCLYINNMHGRNFKDYPIGKPISMVLPDGDSVTYVFAGMLKELAVLPGFYLFTQKPLNSYNEVFVSLKPGYSAGDASPRIEEALTAKGIKVSQVSDVRYMLEALKAHMAPTFLIIQVMGLFTILIGLMGVVIVLSLTLEERANEVGILKAVGSSTRQIVQLFCNEFLSINAIAIVLGIAGTLILTPFLCHLFGNMMMGTGFLPFINVGLMALATGVLLLLQTLLIVGFSRRKIRRQVRVLLE